MLASSLDFKGISVEEKSLVGIKFYSSKSQVLCDRVHYLSVNFQLCGNLIEIDLSNFRTDYVTSLSNMFGDCSELKSLDLSDLDTSNITSFLSLFEGCKSLEKVNLPVLKTHSDNPVTLSSMFHDCENLSEIDFSQFDTQGVTNMFWMFCNCKSLKQLDLSGFDTSNVVSMEEMFYGCRSLRSLDLSAFNTRNVTNIKRMFDGCNSLTTLNISSFDTSNVDEENRLLVEYGCDNLRELALGERTIVKYGLSVSNWLRYSTIEGNPIQGQEILDINNYDGLSPGWYKMQMPLSKVSLSKTVFTYSSKGREPGITVMSNGKTLVEGQDYTVTYKHNRTVGNAKMIVKGIGYYCGSITKVFKINPRGTSIAKLKGTEKAVIVKVKKQAAKMSASRISGYQIQVAEDNSFTKGKKTVKIKGYAHCLKRVNKLKKYKEYFVRVRTYKTVNGKNYYSLWSDIETIITY